MFFLFLQNFEQALAELSNLRRAARDFEAQLKGCDFTFIIFTSSFINFSLDDLPASAVPAKAAGPKKREAVLDRGKEISTMTNYVPKVVSKAQDIRGLLHFPSLFHMVFLFFPTFSVCAGCSLSSLFTPYSYRRSSSGSCSK
jgi:hypothetical protein